MALPKILKKFMSGKVLTIVILIVAAIASFGVSFFVTQKTIVEAKKDQTDQEGPTIDQVLLNGLAAAEGQRLSPGEQELDQLIKEVRIRLQELDRDRRDIETRQKRLDLAAQQLQRQTEDLEKLRVELATLYAPLKEAKSDLIRSRTMIRKEEVNNLQSTATMWGKMDPANTARLIVEMFKNNQADAATKIIYYMEEKSWAAVMDEMQEIGPAVDVIIRQLSIVREGQASL